MRQKRHRVGRVRELGEGQSATWTAEISVSVRRGILVAVVVLFGGDLSDVFSGDPNRLRNHRADANNPGGAGAVARMDWGALVVAFGSLSAGRYFRFDLRESVAAGGKESEVGQESRGRMTPALAVPEAGLDRCGHLGQEHQRETGIGRVTGKCQRSRSVPRPAVRLLADERGHCVSATGGQSTRVGHDGLGDIAQRPFGHCSAAQELGEVLPAHRGGDSQPCCWR